MTNNDAISFNQDVHSNNMEMIICFKSFASRLLCIPHSTTCKNATNCHASEPKRSNRTGTRIDAKADMMTAAHGPAQKAFPAKLMRTVSLTGQSGDNIGSMAMPWMRRASRPVSSLGRALRSNSIRDDGSTHVVVSREPDEDSPPTLRDAECLRSTVTSLMPLLLRISRMSISRGCRLLSTTAS